jgi:hypothetical protein
LPFLGHGPDEGVRLLVVRATPDEEPRTGTYAVVTDRSEG